ncbi:MAG: argininosuccinate lyase [Candidatus Omnitrophica bacterium]|nr:argininosuccinate lyase [Candidatus Omnitrophota bacterium]
MEKKAPEAAKKLHTGRSRNEQVVNDVRLYAKDAIDGIVLSVAILQRELVHAAEKNIDAIIPGYTHLNHAQPVLFPHLLMAYVEMLERDKGRFLDAKKRCDVSVMGSGALAGSSLNLDRKYVQEKLGFSKLSSNSIDSVSDRDFFAEIIFDIAQTSVHLSRMAEDFILYSTFEFGFLDIGEEFCTGSSLMPQKKNPDVLELVRGKAAQFIGSLSSILVLMKGLPHSYNRDLQDDKKALFDSVDTIMPEILIMAELVKTLKVDRRKANRLLGNETIMATDIAEYLVRKGVAFKDAHEIVGNIVRHSIENNMPISSIPIEKMKEFSESVENDVFALLKPKISVEMKKTYGSTSPDFVVREINDWKNKLEKIHE